MYGLLYRKWPKSAVHPAAFIMDASKHLSMEYEAVISDSMDYAREALFGKWVRWLIFVILSLPMALVQFVFDPEKIMAGGTFHWEQINWGELAILVILGIILSFFLSGYLVRIYRGTKPAPDFDNWGQLFMDGLKLAIVEILWLIPLIVVFMAELAVIALGSIAAGGSRDASLLIFLLAMLLFIIIEIVLFIIIFLYMILGAVRFARTGSIREGIRFSAITQTIRRIGWGAYILSLIILFVIGIIFYIVTAVLHFIPYAGWVIVLVITPIFSIFMTRYITLLYEHGEPAAAP
jgi:Protein of unknown function (DUF4013)